MDSPAKITEDEFDIAIAFDGTWFHQGAPIGRLPLVRLFATILKRDDAGQYWLITPVERGRIAVADAPFIANTYRFEGQGTAAQALFLTDNVGREVPVDAAHPITLRKSAAGDALVPYHQLGGGVEARLASAVYYDLVNVALAAGKPDVQGHLNLLSGGVLHPVGAA